MKSTRRPHPASQAFFQRLQPVTSRLHTALVALAIGGLLSGSLAHAETPASPDAAADTLASRLAARSQGSRSGSTEMTPAQLAMAADAKRLAESDILSRALQVGQIAPDFVLPDANGESVRLLNLLERGPVVLTWYRGGWCPYCNIQLAYLQEVLPDFQGLGAQLVAISPELPDNALSTQEKLDLSFTVLSDVGSQTGRAYGVVFQLSPEVQALYNQWFQFDAWNGTDVGLLPLAATYVIGQDGIVAWAHLDTDYRQRAEPSAILEVLRALP